MTEEFKEDEILPQAYTDAVWERLYEFANNQIIWGEGRIDYDSFIEYGKKEFDVTFKQRE